MNKKGFFQIIFWGISLFGVLSVLVFLVDWAAQPQKETCQEQCIKQNMTFYKYSGGGYQDNQCNCKTPEGIIKTIYSE
jgi:hypothetical protein